MVATTSFARQMMDGKEGSWKGEEVLDPGVWKFGRWKIMSEHLDGQQSEVGKERARPVRAERDEGTSRVKRQKFKVKNRHKQKR